MADGHDPRYSDAANRCSDIIREHITAGLAGMWCAIRLSDGGSDGVLYFTREAAIKHQLHEQQCCYVKVPPDDMSPKDAQHFLAANRLLYDSGMRISDPDTEVHVPFLTFDALKGKLRDRRYL